MIDFEKQLFEIAPYVVDVMKASTSLTDSRFQHGRRGWIIRGVINPETRYEHSCKVGLAAWYLIGTKEALEQGVVHDFAEIFTEDYLLGEIKPEAKRKEELEIWQQLRKSLPNGEYWFKVWESYEKQEGISRYVNELDKICPVIQSFDYIKARNGKNLEEFYINARQKLKTPQLISLLDFIQQNQNHEYESAYLPYFEGLKAIKL